MKNKNQEVLIQFKNLTKKFGNFYTVKGIYLEIGNGEIVYKRRQSKNE